MAGEALPDGPSSGPVRRQSPSGFPSPRHAPCRERLPGRCGHRCRSIQAAPRRTVVKSWSRSAAVSPAAERWAGPLGAAVRAARSAVQAAQPPHRRAGPATGMIPGTSRSARPDRPPRQPARLGVRVPRSGSRPRRQARRRVASAGVGAAAPQKRSAGKGSAARRPAASAHSGLPPPRRSLFSRRLRCRPSSTNSTPLATPAGDSPTSRRPTARRSSGISLTSCSWADDGVVSPTSAWAPASKRSISGTSSERAKWRLKTFDHRALHELLDDLLLARLVAQRLELDLASRRGDHGAAGR